ncbi:MAG: hypothetical protein AAGA77_14325 [Bacteroidota bacterium]
MTIKDFISERLEKVIEKLSFDNGEVDFVLFYERGVKWKSQSTWEDMANWWSLPYSVNRRLSKNEAIVRVQFFDSIAPLWIKASLIRKGLVGLELSQKLRKRKEILHHHGGSDLAPFTIEEPYLVFGKTEERKRLLEYLTLVLNSSQDLDDYFNGNPPKKDEIKKCIEKNFEHYLFFPNNYNHREKGKPGYSERIIRKNTNTQSFQLINQDFKILKESNCLDDVVNIYLQEELEYKIGQIEIEK